ncbi:MAG: C39 family peptidase [Patescibacteria group bacterium]|nr:C39 family peptidase [Patescibacteria group bacterium]
MSNKEVILDVPYYSEFIKADGSIRHIEVFKRRSCGIISLKMALDYFSNQKRGRNITLEKLIETALKNGAYKLRKGATKGGGWVYSGLVRTLQFYGYNAWRRHFFILPKDLNVFKEEGVGEKSLDGYKKQVLSEIEISFKNSLDKGLPFLVSIFKDLGSKKSPHLIVITGYREKDGKLTGLFINDPHNPKNGAKNRPLHKNQFISIADFVKIWRKTALFIEAKAYNSKNKVTK